MDYLNELVLLGVDSLILGLCLKEYFSHKKTVNALKEAEQLQLDKSLREYLSTKTNHKVNYAILRGTVTPIGVPIRSVMSPSVTGVLQVIKLNEHRVARGFAGMWTEQHKLIHVSSNEIPFLISNGSNNNFGVEIIDGLSAAVLDLDVVHDNYEPSSLSFFDHIFGFFSGVRQRGIQTTEEILRDGSFITAVGELELDGDTVRLQATDVGPLILTTATKNTIIKKFQDAKSSMMVKIVVCGAISAVLISLIARKIYLKRKQDRDARKLKETLSASRQKRRANVRTLNTELNDDQKCVVCVTNPKEVICLPCGHVCLCEDCSIKINKNCPVCRTKIDTKMAAFL